MASFKARVIDDTILAAKLALVLSSDLPNFLETTYSERARVLGRRWYVVLSIAFLTAILFSFYLLDIDFSHWLDRIIAAMAMCWIVVLMLSGRDWFSSKRLLSREMNMALAPIITNSINALTLYTYSEDTSSEIKTAARNLLADQDIRVESKGCYQVFDDVSIQVNEVRLSSNQDSFLTLFGVGEIGRGVLITAQIDHALDSLIAASARTSLFMDDVWERVCVGHYVVPVSDELQARAAVPTDEKRDLVETQAVTEMFTFLQKYHKKDWMLSIEDGQLQLLLFGDSIEIPLGQSTTDRTVIARQSYSILQPIWKGLRVAELFAPLRSSE